MSLVSRHGATILTICLLFHPSEVSSQQPVPQSPAPMVDRTRPHPRVTQTQVTGRRVELTSLKGARLFVGPKVNNKKPVPLLVHFHGAPWLIEFHVAQHLSRAALITVQLGAGSSAYGRPFENEKLFQSIMDEASQEMDLQRGWSSITLTGFSAGYGGIRQILRTPDYFARVNNVLLLDGMHASYDPEGRRLADGGAIRDVDVHPYVDFAREAVLGRKSFVFTHSEIFPGTYASTTECADYLLAQLKVVRLPQLQSGPMGMHQLSAVDQRGFHLRGYAGNSAPDHVDHLQAMSSWFGLLKIK